MISKRGEALRLLLLIIIFCEFPKVCARVHPIPQAGSDPACTPVGDGGGRTEEGGKGEGMGGMQDRREGGKREGKLRRKRRGDRHEGVSA
jgi:hypothetical protein